MCARCEYSLFGRNGGGRNPDHYWSPCSNGAVPPGATVCGRDKDGSDLYVGRVLYEGDMLPAKVSPSHGGAFFSHGGAEHSCANYEVLLGGNLMWQGASGGQVPPGAVAVGQTANGEILYVGRVFHDATLTVGKVCTGNESNQPGWRKR
ncbi:uncharacterized protein [Periplaneta americana]|uniref:uncharacterized protein isoform X2 n=1 Tax=Periplaneta americana TaxID=6978 RepID=UPI0037E876A3